jgi:drug/metabolite transporter (DMT)-like permease
VIAAVLGGLGASVCWAVSALCASAASRRIGAASTLAWVMTIGLALVAVPTALLADAGPLNPGRIGLLAMIGIANTAGLLIEYVAFRRGKVGVVTPIASTEGAIAALIAVIAGLRTSVRTGVLLGVVTVGVILAAAHPDPPDPSTQSTGVRSAVLALPVALLFGITLYTTGRVGSEVSVLWVLLPARLIGTMLITAPLAARRELRRPGPTLPLVAAAGAGEVLGILSYALGARHQLAIAAVLASQFAALAAVGAYFAFGERLTRLQLAGLVVVAIGVGLLAAGGT